MFWKSLAFFLILFFCRQRIVMIAESQQTLENMNYGALDRLVVIKKYYNNMNKGKNG